MSHYQNREFYDATLRRTSKTSSFHASAMLSYEITWALHKAVKRKLFDSKQLLDCYHKCVSTWSSTHLEKAAFSFTFPLKKLSAIPCCFRLWSEQLQFDILTTRISYANANFAHNTHSRRHFRQPNGWKFSCLSSPRGTNVLKLMTENLMWLKSQQLKSHNGCTIKMQDYECLICHDKELHRNWNFSPPKQFPSRRGDGEAGGEDDKCSLDSARTRKHLS